MFKKESLKAGVVVSGVICTMLFVLIRFFSIAQVWPALLPTLMFMIGVGMIGPAMYSQIKNIFVGGVVGLILNLIQMIAVGLLAPTIGLIPAIILTVFITIWIIIMGGDISQVVFSNYTFTFWLIAGAMTPDYQNLNGTLLLMGTLVIAGGILMAAILTLLIAWKVLPAPTKE